MFVLVCLGGVYFELECLERFAMLSFVEDCTPPSDGLTLPCGHVVLGLLSLHQVVVVVFVFGGRKKNA